MPFLLNHKDKTLYVESLLDVYEVMYNMVGLGGKRVASMYLRGKHFMVTSQSLSS